ncbi:hypothetical protein Cgig2_020369 [Carnegiea gigantea]|uniref:Uncharacterized protein n=1 Tax=Carnegiea gigantea TaxID=171969 RepID=A0A9Q1KDY6_9CARY|nr:hypothetical protein Cgig2_020369 [Carnegiea gigantea]
MRSCLSSSRLRSVAAATCSRVASPVSKTLSTLGEVLKDQKAGHNEKEVIRKKLYTTPNPRSPWGPSKPCEPGQMPGPSRAARYTAIHLTSGSFTVAFGSGSTKEYSAGRRYCFSRADLLSLVTALGSGKWLLRPSCGSERVGALGNSSPSATISVTGGVRPTCLGTEPTGPDDDLVGQLIEAPSEDDLREECPEAELREPDREEVLELKEATSASEFD